MKHVGRRDFLKAMGFGTAALAAGPGASVLGETPSTGNRPNILFIYSDDHGKSWDRGEIVISNCERVPNLSETVAVELTDGRVMLNIRNESKKYRRLISYSNNGIDNWSEPQFDEGLYWN